VRTHELRRWQAFLNSLHVHERHDRFVAVVEVDFNIVFYSFYIKHIVQVDSHQFVFAFDEDETVGLFLIRGVNLLRGEVFQSLVACLEKIVVADGLQQVVHSIHFVAVNSILVEGRREDNPGLWRQDSGKLQPAELWNLNVGENKVDRMLPEFSHGRNGTIERPLHVEVRDALGIAKQQFGSQGLIVDNHTINSHAS